MAGNGDAAEIIGTFYNQGEITVSEGATFESEQLLDSGENEGGNCIMYGPTFPASAQAK